MPNPGADLAKALPQRTPDGSLNLTALNGLEVVRPQPSTADTQVKATSRDVRRCRMRGWRWRRLANAARSARLVEGVTFSSATADVQRA